MVRDVNFFAFFAKCAQIAIAIANFRNRSAIAIGFEKKSQSQSIFSTRNFSQIANCAQFAIFSQFAICDFLLTAICAQFAIFSQFAICDFLFTANCAQFAIFSQFAIFRRSESSCQNFKFETFGHQASHF